MYDKRQTTRHKSEYVNAKKRIQRAKNDTNQKSFKHAFMLMWCRCSSLYISSILLSQEGQAKHLFGKIMLIFVIDRFEGRENTVCYLCCYHFGFFAIIFYR